MRLRSEQRVSAAIFAISVALFTILAFKAAHAGVASNSQASNNESEWWGTSSGWVKNWAFYYNEVLRRRYVPTGNWNEDYKHWFGIGGEPAAWTTFKSVPKTPAKDWGVAAPIDDNFTSTSAGGSTATSYWYIKTAIDGIYDNKGNKLFDAPTANFYTKSYANATQGSNDQLANSRTRIRDPIVAQSPQTDPNWDPSLPLDPSGNWTFGGQVALWELLGRTVTSTGHLP
jgi:hypothetical protein